jgi:hypothetical protein
MSFYLDAKGSKDQVSIEVVRIKSSHGPLHKKRANDKRFFAMVSHSLIFFPALSFGLQKQCFFFLTSPIEPLYLI